MCKSCGRQFIGDHALSYKGRLSTLTRKIMLMSVIGLGIRDIARMENISINKVLSVLPRHDKIIKPKQSYYKRLEIDEFRTYVGNKGNKVRIIYAYAGESGEIVAYVRGKRNLKTARVLKNKLISLGIVYESICTDDRDGFITAFKGDNCLIGKKYATGIEGNNCRLRHRVRRAFRKTCCFSKKLLNRIKAFDSAFFYIDFGYV